MLDLLYTEWLMGTSIKPYFLYKCMAGSSLVLEYKMILFIESDLAFAMQNRIKILPTFIPWYLSSTAILDNSKTVSDSFNRAKVPAISSFTRAKYIKPPLSIKNS